MASHHPILSRGLITLTLTKICSTRDKFTKHSLRFWRPSRQSNTCNLKLSLVMQISCRPHLWACWILHLGEADSN